jgi:hypothetical protein
MTRLHPTDPSFAESYGIAWTSEPARLAEFFAPDGIYTDVAMDTTWQGHDEIGRFHRFMTKFAPDSYIEFQQPLTGPGWFSSEWRWSGTAAGALKLRDGGVVDATGKHFEVPGVAVCRFRADGALTSHKDFWELATVLHQIGPV